ncbi:P-loop NTPase fold protein [Actinophytocola sp. KF-1]
MAEALPVRDTDPMTLLAAPPRRGKLERYLPRDVDGVLDRALVRPGLVLVTHETGAGARRSVYEALLRNHPNLPLVQVPRFDEDEVPDRAAVWVDLLEDEPGGVSAAATTVRRLRTPGRYVVVLIGAADTRLGGLRRLLDELRPAVVHIGNQLSDREVATAKRLFDADVDYLSDLTALLDRTESAPVRHAAGYHADTDEGTDQLGIDTDVRMLADLVASRLVRPPLSIGLFGNWGSGKSFFMRQMRARVRELADAAADEERRAGERGRDVSSYCSSIRQITFNAWHYAEANLWASLATHIFDGLAAGGAEDVLRRRADDLAELRQAEQSLLTQLSAVRLERRLVAAQQERRPVRLDLTGEDFAWVAQELGVDEATTTEVRRFATELGGAGVEARRVWALLRRSRFALVMGAVAIVLAVALAVLVRSPVWPVLAAAVPLLVGALPVVTRVREAMARIRRAADSADAALDQRIAELDEETARLERAVAELATGHDATAFAKSRYESGEYRGHLGIVSVLRRDLETFAAILDKERATEGGLERVVLYVDDLDRCPPAVVIKVLEAVHLLVALPVFVVVVAVDPRWLHQAIRLHYATMLPDHVVTPAHYLEKIFQIPFRLPDMDEDGFRRLVWDLSGIEDVAHDQQVTSDPDRYPVSQLVWGGRITVDPLAPETAPAPPVRPFLRPRQLHVSDVELGFLASLAALVPTPRAAKRLMNLYRLVRARLSDHELDRFVQDGDHRAVLVLLALHAGSGAAVFDRFDTEPDLAWLTELVGVALPADKYREWLPLVRRFSFGDGRGPRPEPGASRTASD